MEQIKKPEIICKPNLSATLDKLELNVVYELNNSDFKITAVRNKLSQLRKEGIKDFIVSELKSDNNKYIIKRIK